jgi:hypothetical protein
MDELIEKTSKLNIECGVKPKKYLIKCKDNTSSSKTTKDNLVNIDKPSIVNIDNVFDIDNISKINIVKKNGIIWVENILKKDFVHTKPGTISHLLFGKKMSEQSINIKMGRFGEYISKELILQNKKLELLQCGIQQVGNIKKDIDLIFKNIETKTIYYRELKGNIILDTEKLPATICKCKEIDTSLKSIHTEYKIDCGILNWSIYDRKILTSGLSCIKAFEKGGIKIDHISEFLQIVEIEWDENSYYEYFRYIGNIISNYF